MSWQLNNYQIKLLAAIFMVIDHIGDIFLPTVLELRVIGRLSFPLFAWLLTQGEQHTHNFNRYLFRLVLLGLVSQPLYLLVLEGNQLNIIFTLALGLLLLRWSRRLGPGQVWLWLGGMVAAELLQMEYGAYGLLAIALLAQAQSGLWWSAWLGLHGLVALWPTLGPLQSFAVFTPLLLWSANQQQGAPARWFYSFYPLHLLILGLLARWLSSAGTSPLLPPFL